jgi:hypothetical protein
MTSVRLTTERRPGAMLLTTIGGWVIYELVLWLSDRRRTLRWRAQGAISRWEHDLARRRTRQADPRRAPAPAKQDQ